METKICFNPKCSTCRNALELLQDKVEDIEIIEYLKDTPSVEQLDEICKLMKAEPTAILRVKEPRFAELGLSIDDERSRGEWLQLMHDNPSIIQRPIFIHNGKAVLGRPPEKVLDIL